MYFIYNPFPDNHFFFVECLKLYYQSKSIHIQEISVINNNDKDELNTYFILINHMYFIENKEAKQDLHFIKHKKNKILYITEPIELLIEKQYYQKLISNLKPQTIYSYCEENRNKIKTFIPIDIFYPINKEYLTFTSFNTQLFNKRIKDKIVFIGKINDYRNRLKDIFQDDLVIIENKYKKDEWLTILNTYQFYVNVHRRPNSKCFEAFRCIPLLMNGGIILSEHVNEEDEKKYKNTNIYFCKLEEMKTLFNSIKLNNSFGTIFEKIL